MKALKHVLSLALAYYIKIVTRYYFLPSIFIFQIIFLSFFWRNILLETKASSKSAKINPAFQDASGQLIQLLEE